MKAAKASKCYEVAGGLVKLESVDHRLMQVRVVELMVEPDDIFEAFHTPPMSFLCKGQARTFAAKR